MIGATSLVRTFQAPGPKAAGFINSDERINGIMGPMRGGKTTAALYKRLRRAMRMPKCRDGNRDYSCVVIRDSYGALYETTIRSWHLLFDKNIGKWQGSEGRPASHDLVFDCPDGGKLFFRIRFLSIQNDTIENLLRGTEFTDALLEEADLLDEHVLTYVNGRVGQWPHKNRLPAGVVAPGQVDIVTNPPDVENWFYRRFVRDMLPKHEFFQQPSGLSPEAENLENIPGGRGYYEDLAATNPKWWVDRMVHGKFGASRSGEAVYRDEWDDRKHCGNRIILPADAPLLLGFDQNLVNPACTIHQWMPSGQWRWIDEILPGRMGAKRMGETVREVLQRDYRGLPVAGAWIDPSTMHGADTEGGELAYYEQIRRASGINIMPAPSQEVGFRISSISNLLRAPDIVLATGEIVPALTMSARCKVSREGMNSRYRFKRSKPNDPNSALQPKPEKNEWSDPLDSGQYAITGAMGRIGIVAGVQAVPKYAPPKPVQRGPRSAPGDFNVFKV